MAYTPELSHEASCTLRRLSWSMGKPMTETMEWVFSDLVKFIPSQAVCEGCKDKSKCGSCSFNSKGKQEQVLLNKKEAVDEEYYSGRNKEIQASHKRAV